jgi:3-oxoacyl-[acyl-carrier-protein] synthase-1
MNRPPPHRPAAITPVAITAQTATCAVGIGLDALARAIAEQRSGLRPNDLGPQPLSTWIGRVDGVEDVVLPAALAGWDCRATRLAWLGLQADGFIAAVQAACARFGAGRVGLVLGTSASTIGASEQAYRELDADGRFPAPLRSERLNTPHALASFVQQALGLEGPSLTVSTACSSSAKALAVAERWLRLGLADAVVTAGVDALCNSVLFGFRALGLVSDQPCRPFDARRSGISVGEAAAFALLQRGPGPLQLLGYGEANDAHHMSSPHPLGLGAEAALDDALARAGLAAEMLDHVNLHGTASARNDEVEAALVARRYAPDTQASATKGLTGHTMGAAGLLEALACGLVLERGVVPGSAQTAAAAAEFGTTFAGQLQLRPRRAPVRVAASHSFGFGGNNCVVVLGRGAAA